MKVEELIRELTKDWIYMNDEVKFYVSKDSIKNNGYNIKSLHIEEINLHKPDWKLGQRLQMVINPV